MCEAEGRPGCSMEEEPTAGTFATEQTYTALRGGSFDDLRGVSRGAFQDRSGNKTTYYLFFICYIFQR